MTGSTSEHTPVGGNSVPGPWDITSSVGVTALAVAAARAVEADRPDALVRDRHAAGFVRAADHRNAFPTTQHDVSGPWSTLVDMMAVRTRVLDDLLLRTAADGLRQYVVLAAGLDARAFRLAWPTGTTVYEVDQPPVLEFKQQTTDAAGTRPACDRRPVPMDLREDWAGALVEAGFDPATPTSWLIEGLLPYLPAQAEADLFAQIDKLSAPGSRASIECFAQDKAAELVRHNDVRPLNDAMGCDMDELWNTEPRQDTLDRLTDAGWTAHARRIQDLAAELGRPVDDGMGRLTGQVQIIDAVRG